MRVKTTLYSIHCVACAVAHQVAHILPQFPPVPPCQEVFPVVAYEGFTATPAVHILPPPLLDAPQFTHPREGHTVQVAKAVPPVCPLALFPFLWIFAVPVKVSVHFTYIANPLGFKTIPVFTVRLL